MITFTLLIAFSGFYFCYHASKKAEPLRTTHLAQWIPVHATASKGVGVGLLLVAAWGTISLWGLGAGLLFYFVILMTWASLMVILGPVRVLGPRTLLALSVLSLLFEIAF